MKKNKILIDACYNCKIRRETPQFLPTCKLIILSDKFNFCFAIRRFSTLSFLGSNLIDIKLGVTTLKWRKLHDLING